MKKTIAILATIVASFSFADGAAITVTNYDEASGAQLGISIASGAGLLTGGVVQVGSFAADPASLISALNPTNAGGAYEALLSAFTSFGSTNTIGGDYSGLFESVKEANIASDNALVGKSIYTLIGNGATLQSSTELAILVDAQQFNYDDPVFARRSNLTADTVTAAFGSKTGPAVETALGASTASIQLAPVAIIPEPMSAALLIGSLAFVVRRRRE